MKRNRTYIFIVISSIALIIVLIIQVNWIIQTAKIKEDMFNEKANMILAKTTEAINLDKETCKKIGACVGNSKSSESAAKLGKDEIHTIDSLFNHYMKFYNFHVDYTYVITKTGNIAVNGESGFANYSYYKPLDDVEMTNGVELKLIFPDKKQYIIAEMGTLFITSVILILVVLVMFWRTILSLMKEKKISEHTTEFLNNMTHEFKTPLANISLAGSLIQMDKNANDADKIKYYSGIILQENEKLRMQVEHVLSMNALERGEIPLRKTELDFHLLIKESLKCMSMQMESKHGEVKLNLNAEKSIISGDKTQLTNALCNLIDNAIKYSKDKLEITIQTFNKDHNLIIVFSDNGIGIEKEYQKKVFDKYYRVPTGDVHDVKGFGLGLAYVKKILILHDGTIEMQSEKGSGTTFTITLPND